MKVVVFFFQAEDGIRDVAVTGVQTCALPICLVLHVRHRDGDPALALFRRVVNGVKRPELHLRVMLAEHFGDRRRQRDRKSTRLNSSHGYISYAVFCLKKKKKIKHSNIVAIYKNSYKLSLHDTW